MGLRLGIDFDNTLVRYDALFHRVALEQGLIPADLPVNKNAVRDHLRAAGIEEKWTEMQGTVYGSRMAEAQIFPDALEVIARLRASNVSCFIISHKTRHPFLGEKHDLHAAARRWIEANHLPIPMADIFFEETKEAKLARIASCRCTAFVDDLPEIVDHPLFPPGPIRFLFDPAGTLPLADHRTSVSNWAELGSLLLPLS